MTTIDARLAYVPDIFEIDDVGDNAQHEEAVEKRREARRP
jgi:hypothetical protein